MAQLLQVAFARHILPFILLLGLAIAFVPARADASTAPCGTTGIPAVTTDKTDYAATDTALITGQGFGCGEALFVRVTRPDGIAVSADGLGSAGPDAVTTDASGAFQLSYQLAGTWPDGSVYVGQEGEYVVDVLDASGIVLASTTFTDSHFRFGHVTWKKVGTNKAEFEFTIGFRNSSPSYYTVGRTACIESTLNFGDGTSACVQVTVIYVSGTNSNTDWFLAKGKITHQYNTAGPFTAFNGSCCRVSFLSNSANAFWRFQTVVDFRGITSGAPVSQLPAIVDCPQGGTCTFNVPGTQPDLHNVTYRLATTSESSATQPAGASINSSTGLYSLNTTTKAAGTLWTSQVILEDRSASNTILSTSAIDFMIRIVQASAPPRFIVPPSPASGSTLGVGVGQTLTFAILASDADGPSLALNVIGLPAGATFPTPGTGNSNEKYSTFSWTPTAAQIGAYSLIFTATDGQTTQTHAVSINVSALTVQKTLSVVSGPNPPEAGATTTYAMTIRVILPANAPSPVDGIVVTDRPGPAATFLSIGSSSHGTASFDTGTNTMIWNLGTLNAGFAAHLTYNVTVSPTTSDVGNTLTLNAGARANGTERVSGAPVASLSNTLSAGPVAPPSNQPPTANAGGPYSVGEGSSIALSGSGTDPNGDPLTYAWDLDNDGVFETPGQNPAFSAAGRDGPGSHTVALQVCDNKSACATSSATVTITNVAPTVSATNVTVTVPEGVTANNTGSFSDVTTDAVTLAASAGTITKIGGSSGTWSWALPTNDGPIQSQTVTVTATDDDGGVTTTTFQLTVNNLSPKVLAGPDATINEGQTFTQSSGFPAVVFSDTFETGASPAWSTTQVTNFNGQNLLGQFGNGFVTLTVDALPAHSDVTLSFDFHAINSWDGNGTHCCGPDFFDIALAGGPTLLRTTFSTVSGAGVTQSFPGSYPTYNPPYTGAIAVGGGEAVYRVTVTAPHTSPVVSFVLAASNLQGLGDESWGIDNVTVSVTTTSPAFVDHGTADTHTATVDYGDGTGVQPLALGPNRTFSLSHLYADDAPSGTPSDTYTVTVTVCDDDNLPNSCGADTVLVTVNNVAPTATFIASSPVIETELISLSLVGASDPSTIDTGILTYAFDCGDGAGYGPSGAGNTRSCPTTDNGTRTVKGKVQDDDGGVTEYLATIVISNVAPVVNAGSDASITEGGPLTGAGSFTDPGPDTWTATVDYGDGSGAQPLALTGKNFNLSHVYADSGTYTVTVAVTDDDGGVGSDTLTVTVAEAPPVLTVGDTSTYTEDGAPVVVAPSLTLTDPGNDGIDGARVSIGANFNSAQDSLGIQGQSGTSGTVGGLPWSFSPTSGVLTLSGVASPAAYESALRQVTYSNGSQNPSAAPRTVTFNIGTQLSSPTNGHFYEFVSSFGIAWNVARDAAAARDLYGLQGYLATITSSNENAFIYSKVQGNGWLGGNDSAVEGTWKWVTGPEAGTVFCIGQGFCVPQAGAYANWNGGEPNNAGNEDYVHMIGNPAIGQAALGRWNDLPIQVASGDYAVLGYLVEYGGMAGDPILQLSGNATVNVVAVNDAPVANAGGPYTVNEGAGVVLTGSGSDLDSAALSYAWDLDNDGVFETAGQNVTFTGVDGPAIHTVSLRVCDTGTPLPSLCATSQSTVTVNNVAPTITAFFQVAPSPEATATSIVAQATDPAGSNDLLLFAFDCDNNGTYERDANPSTSGAECFFADSGTYTVGVKVADGDGGEAFGSTSVVITNTAPTAFLSGDGGVNEGSTATVLFTNQFDPSPVDTGAGFHYAYDFNNDGTFEVGDGTYAGGVVSASATVPAAFLTDGPATRTVRGRILDKDGGYSENTAIIQVNNVAPAVAAGPDATIDEGSTFSGSGSFTDPGADTWTGTVNYGDGTATEPLALAVDKTFSFGHVYADDGVYTITLTVTDDDGGSGSDTLSVTVTNAAPTVDAGPDQTTPEGSSISLAPATFRDAGTLDTHTATIDWGDGSPFSTGTVAETPSGPPGSTTGTDGTVSGSHTYADDGTYTVNVCVTDDEGARTCDTLTVTVTNVAPFITADGDTIAEDGTAAVSGTITDPGTQDTFTLVIDWGEGVPVTYSYPAGTATYSESHQYLDDTPTGTASDTYAVSVTVTDDDGGSGSAATTVTVNNVTPVVTASGSTINENGTATVAGTVTDPGSLDTFTLVIDWGEGTPETHVYPAGTASYSLTHQYLDDNPTGTGSDTYSVSVTVTDDDTGVGAASTTVTVNNVAPAVTAIGATIDENGTATVSGTITDPSTQDAFTVVIAWGPGEGSTTLALGAGATSFSGTHQYLDDNPTGTASDSYGVSVTVTDDDGGVGMASTSVVVNNVAPQITNSGMAIDENGVATVSGSITDPGTQDSFTVVIDWGEGSPQTYYYPAGATSYSETHQYLDDNPTGTGSDVYTVNVTATDDDTGSGASSATVTVTNVAPQITASGATIVENGTATVSGTITDPGTQDTFTVVIAWGEGAPQTYNYPAGANSYSETHQYLDDNPTGTGWDTYSVSVTVTDDDGGAGSASTTVVVNNVAPVLSATGSVISENGSATVSGTITDPGTQDTFTLVIDWGEGTPVTYSYAAGTATYSESHQYLDDNPTVTASDIYAISVTVTDDDTGVGTAATTVTVNNVAPAASLTIGKPVIDENGLAFITVTFSDTGSQDTHTIDIDWGLGETPDLGLPITTGATTFTHQYLDDNPTGTASDVYTVSVTVRDDDGGTSTASGQITVNNVAPVITGVTAPIAPVSVGTPVTLTISLTDTGTLDSHGYTITWDDGTTTTGDSGVTGSGSFSVTHTYAAATVATVKVTITDDDGATAVSEYRFVVVYDTSAGFVTGGGWINSPAGAYQANLSASGKATFGFVSKYLPGRQTPDGNTEFQLHFATFNFKSTAYDFLVISGYKAQYRGVGTVNGEAGYSFLLTAYDGNRPGGDGKDRFRIKIWKTGSGEVVYDNRFGASDDVDSADPQVIDKGSIVIHTRD